MTSWAAFSALGPVGSVADSELFTSAQAENLRTTAGGRERERERGEEVGSVLMGDCTGMFCGALIRCEVVSNCCSHESRQGGMQGKCVHVSVCVWVFIFWQPVLSMKVHTKKHY